MHRERIVPIRAVGTDTDLRTGRTICPLHQVSIIATAIYDARKDRPHGGMDPEEAKQVAKCIIEALSDAGLRIVPVSDD